MWETVISNEIPINVSFFFFFFFFLFFFFFSYRSKVWRKPQAAAARFLFLNFVS